MLPSEHTHPPTASNPCGQMPRAPASRPRRCGQHRPTTAVTSCRQNHTGPSVAELASLPRVFLYRAREMTDDVNDGQEAEPGRTDQCSAAYPGPDEIVVSRLSSAERTTTCRHSWFTASGAIPPGFERGPTAIRCLLAARRFSYAPFVDGSAVVKARQEVAGNSSMGPCGVLESRTPTHLLLTAVFTSTHAFCPSERVEVRQPAEAGSVEMTWA